MNEMLLPTFLERSKKEEPLGFLEALPVPSTIGSN